jgi:hypothetical protein
VAAWTRPPDITAVLRKRWRRGDMLAAHVSGEPIFPLEIALKRPGAREVAEQFGAVKSWAESLRRGSRAVRGRGYDLRWERTGNRVQGANELPVAARIETEAQALYLLKEEAAVRRFDALAEQTLKRFPQLAGWLEKRCMQALKHADDWPAILRVLDYFATHHRSGLYLRQLDIPGVDTKFIEARRKLIAELLDEVLPDGPVDATATGAANFARRYGLRTEPVLIRFRILDPDIDLHGLTDLSVPVEEFARLELPVSRVFITENRINGLAMPACPQSLVIFGLGYGLDRLSDIALLARCQLWYWGDIDTHGFGILDRLRRGLPHARSLLMDRDTLLAHRHLWVAEPAEHRYRGEPECLTVAERELFEDLRDDRIGERVRLEQERIGYGAVQATVRAAAGRGTGSTHGG